MIKELIRPSRPPSDSVPQLMRKVKQYFAAGCNTVWIVYPDAREIHSLDASGSDLILRDGDLMEAPELLPGFLGSRRRVLRIIA